MADQRYSYIIAITGGRDFTDKKVISRVLQAQIIYAHLTLEDRRPILLTGGCPTGVDELARQWWHRKQRPYVVDPAAFNTQGRSAGPRRNSRMAIGSTFAMDPPFHPDVLLVFPGGTGTADCRKKFEGMGVPIAEVIV